MKGADCGFRSRRGLSTGGTMRKLNTVAVSALFLTVAAPVHAQEVVCFDELLTSQAAVDAFDCTEVLGDVHIQGTDIVNLSGLSELESIDGDLGINYTSALISLEGLEGLTAIGGDLRVTNNDGLETLAGLEGLTSVGGTVDILLDPALVSLEGLASLTSVGGEFIIEDDDALTSLAGLEKLGTVGAQTFIEENDALTSLVGLGALTSTGGLQIFLNPVLPSLAGLGSLTTDTSLLLVAGNASLVSLAGLEKLTTVGGKLTIGANPSLTSLEALENLAFIGGVLEIAGNSSLQSLDGLDHVTSVGSVLMSMVTSVTIQKNPDLRYCSCGLSGLVSSGAFTGVNGSVFIQDNDPTGLCNSPEQVLGTPCVPQSTPPTPTPIPQASGGGDDGCSTVTPAAQNGVAAWWLLVPVLVLAWAWRRALGRER
jgi:hypothetical protein